MVLIILLGLIFAGIYANLKLGAELDRIENYGDKTWRPKVIEARQDALYTSDKESLPRILDKQVYEEYVRYKREKKRIDSNRDLLQCLIWGAIGVLCYIFIG
ncbi:MAG: hypothetical protein KTR16_07105 [Acidiferrobacterales bacterium]|nr:hypothetical protein [Acidiferrobacterales bacterium]